MDTLFVQVNPSNEITGASARIDPHVAEEPFQSPQSSSESLQKPGEVGIPPRERSESEPQRVELEDI